MERTQINPHGYFAEWSTALQNEDDKIVRVESAPEMGIALTFEPSAKKKKKFFSVYLSEQDVERLKNMLTEAINHQSSL